MNTKSLTIFLVVVVVVGLGFYFWRSGNQSAPLASVPAASNDQAMMEEEAPAPKEPQTMIEENTVEISSEGFAPSEIKIKKGDTVTWINKDSAQHWPATAAHPTHTTYPGSDIQKCGTAMQSEIFDACKGLVTGESFSFKFDQVGTWKYHDHVKPTAPFFGSVTVE